MDDTEGFQCLGHSNWTICSPLSYFCFQVFTTFSPSHWEANSYYPRGPIMGKGKSHNPKTEWDSGFWVLGAFILDHLHHFKPIYSWTFLNFFTFILESQFLLPQRANNGSWENFPFPNMDDTEGFQCLGHSNWSICSPLRPFCSESFQTFSLSYWGANSYYPRGANNGKERFIQLQNWMGEGVFSAWGIQTGPLAALCTSHILKLFHLFHLHTGRPILITPEGQ